MGLKNSKFAGIPNIWTVNWQELLQNPDNSHAYMDATTHIATKYPSTSTFTTRKNM